MKGIVRSFRSGKKTQKPRHFIIEVESVKDLKKAKTFVGKEVTWKSPKGKEIKGKITSTHGQFKLRAVFNPGLPGQAINTTVEIK
ncbi:MAG: 50S ribosomal protein L35ae [archaeon]|nr:MAG: 50S ribosomal protein L35ae [archaeon]